WRVVQAEKLLLHDANDREDLIVEANRSTDDAWISVVEPGPRAMAEHGHRISARRAGVEVGKRPSGKHPRSKPLKIVAGHKRNQHRRPVGWHRPIPLTNHVVEQIPASSKFLVIAPAERATGRAAR